MYAAAKKDPRLNLSAWSRGQPKEQIRPSLRLTTSVVSGSRQRHERIITCDRPTPEHLFLHTIQIRIPSRSD